MPDLEILYQDEHVIAINKPAGLPSQQTMDPKRPHVISVLKQQIPGQNFYLHHRLDKDTSGVLLLGKSKAANGPLTDIFREHRIQKTYLCLCLRKNLTATHVDRPDFSVTNHIAPVRGQGKKLMRMVIVKSGGWFAETHFRVLEKFKDYDLIEAKPITGRTHQIRVHIANLRRPIAGDNLYGGKSTEVPRLLLHARELQLAHPVSGAELVIQAPLPADFTSVLRKLGHHQN